MTTQDKAYNLVIIGAGPGGYVAAIRAAQLGLRTAVVEREEVGGVCLNWGCIPTKALLRNAEVISLLERGKEFGFTFDNLQVDFAAAIQRSRQVSQRLVKGVHGLLKKNQVDLVQGEGRLLAPGRVAVEPGGRVLEAPNVILATGARPRSIPGLEIDGQRILSSRHALAREECPQSIIIVGAGAIGVEFAHFYRTYGAQVTLVEMLPAVLPLEDEEISTTLARSLQRRKINVRTGTRTEGATINDDGVAVRVRDVSSGAEETLSAEVVLVAIGVRPNSENLGLEAAGVQVDRGGFVPVDGFMRTNVPGIYAIGDLTGKLLLAHVASAQGIVAAEHIAGHPTQPIEDYAFMPRCTYCHPQVASLGLTEAQAKERGHEIHVGRFPFQGNGKALGLAEREGFVKIIGDAVTGEILGVHMIGPEVTELLPELALARTLEATAEEVARTVHAHPTLSEAVMEAAHGVEGQPIHL
ncbi:MAG: dihydrolipoyl dehydrogenase [Anaerolineae bacterium]|nr:dihydrolipoyl dehydrogenase [Anaerolineae bacterium]